MSLARSIWICLALVAPGLAACEDTPSTVTYDELDQMIVEHVDAPTPVLDGTVLRVTGQAIDLAGAHSTLVVTDGASTVRLPSLAEYGAGERFFEVTPELVTEFGVGARELEVVLVGDYAVSQPFAVSWTTASTIPIALTSITGGRVHRNDVVAILGDGLLGESEGYVVAHFSGSFVGPDGVSGQVRADLPVTLIERLDRNRGVLVLSTDLGGVFAGTFTGSVTLESFPKSGSSTTSAPQQVSFEFVGPELYALSPEAFSLEQRFQVQGAGFLGGAERPDESTTIFVDGTFFPDEGEPRRFVDALVLEYESGTTLFGVLEAEAQGGRLVSKLFHAARGHFEGEAQVVVTKGPVEVRANRVPVTFSIAPVRQVVWIHFLPGFYDGLALYGLAAAAGEIEPLVKARMERIYERWNVDFRLERPKDFSGNGFATVEIGGPDPNGAGLFGYDNTPGKDQNNLRLYDVVGGANIVGREEAEYGGIFIDQYLWWSRRPGINGGRPGGLLPDPLFDEIFDPVRRNKPASRAEINQKADADRVADVWRAVQSLANMVGETSAHELGHTLGLANPHLGVNFSHNSGDGPGCLMDSGGNRPVGERVAAEGFAETEFCAEAEGYLDRILPR